MPVSFAASVQSVSSSSDFDPENYFNPQAMVDGSSTTTVVLQRVKGNANGYYLFEDEAGNKTIELPAENGSYKVTLTEAGMARVRELFAGKVNFNNYEMVNQTVGVLNVVSTSAMIHYVDADNNDEPLDVQYTQVIAGEPNSKLEFGDKLRIPEGYQLAVNQPTSVTLGALGSNTNVTIKLVRNRVVVTPEDPKTPQDKLPETPGKDYPDGTNYPTGVAQDDLNRTITRTITQKLPSGEEKTTTQTVTFARSAMVDLVSGEVTYGEWKQTGSWDKKDVAQAGYTAHITQTVNGTTTTLTSIDQVTVTPDSQDTTVTVTYSAEASATLSGKASSDYSGSAISWDDVNSEDNGNNIKVTVTGPNGGDYKLQQGDVEFSANGTDWSTALPTNAGTYQIHWTQAGIANIKKKFGNASITWGDKDANIKGSATYTINAATVDVTLSGSGTKVYDGQPVSTTELNNEANGGKNNIHAEIQVSINGTITSIDYILQDGDYTWVDYPNPTPDDGHPDYVTNGQAPTDVEPGQAYKIQLNRKSQTFIDHITAAILKQNPDFEGNFEISSESAGNQDATFTITPAPAKLEQTGSADKTYDGKAGSVTLEQLLNNLKPSLADGKPLYGKDAFNTTGLTLDDFDWYEGNTDLGKVSGKDTAPKNVGHYTIKLNQDGLNKIAGRGDQNYNPNYSFLTGPEGNQEPNYSGAFKYDINQADGTVSIKNTTENNYSKPYDGQPTTSVDMSKLTVTAADGKPAVIDFSTTGLTDDDFVFTDAEGNVLANQPTAAGTYYIKLTTAGLAQLNTANPNYKLTYDNSLATYQITQADLTVKQSGSSNHDYTDSPLSPELSGVLANLKATAGLVNGESLNTSGLTLADFDWTAKTDAGDYTLKLNAAGLKTLQDNNKNYSISAVTGAYTFTINKANGKAVFGGDGSKTYNGSAITDYKPTITVTAPGTATIVDLTAGTDYVWYLLDANGNKTGSALTTAPADAGNYSVELTTVGKGKITALNAANIDWTGKDAITGTGSYIISKATATVNFTNSSGQTVDYSGQTGKFDASKFTPSITTNNGQTLTIPEGVHLSLAAGDFTINGVKTTTEPVALGSYTIGLSDTGFAKLQSATNNYNWDNKATASYVVKANDKATVTVTNNVADGGHQTVVYKGSAFGTNDINLGDYALTLPTGLTYQLQAGDLELVSDPTNVGTYTVQLSQQGKTNLQKAGGDNFKFDFDKAGVANTTANFEITKATPSVSFNGVGSKTFGQDDEAWTTPAGLTFTDAPGMGNQTISLANGDYEFVGQDGTVYQSVPTNAGTYKVQLTDQGKGKITASTINSANLDWAKAQISGEGSFTVNAVAGTATLSGTNGRDYNGLAVTTTDINNGGNIVVTIAIPNSDKTISYKLADGDYTWKDNTDPTNVGTYTIELNKDNILAHLQAQIANDPTWKGNVTLTDANLLGTAAFTINQKASSVSLTGDNYKDPAAYTGSRVSTPLATLKAALTSADNLVLPDLFANNFNWYDQTGKQLDSAPTAAGSYTIRLNDAGLKRIQRKNPNYKISIGTNSYGFKIKSATGHVVLNNNATDTFTGVANNDVYKNYTLTLSTEPSVTDKIGYTLQKGDLQFLVNGKWTYNVPTNVGTYEVRLGQKGWDNLKNSSNNNSQNINWLATESQANKNYYTITAASATASLGGKNSMVYDGQAPAVSDVNGGTIGVTLTFPGATDANKVFKLTDASYYTWNTPNHTDVGNYTITLTDAGKTAIQNYIDSIVGEGNVILSGDAATGSAEFDITPAQLTVEQSGNGSKTYNGDPASVDLTTLTNANNWTATGLLGGQSLSIPSTLTMADFAWYQENADGSETKLNEAPTDAGNYALKLNESGLTKLKNANKNYNVNVSGKYSYTINKADAVISLDPAKNKQESPWTGSAIAVNPADFVPSIKDSSNKKDISYPSTLTLVAGDYTVSQDGKAATAQEPGTYQIQLTEQGWKKVANAVTGTGNYNWSYSGNGTLTIAKKQQAITISGSQTVTYTGDAAVLPTNEDGTLKGYTVELGNGLTYQLRAGDLEFVKAEHTNAGTYKLKLSDAGLENIKKLAEGNHYDYSYTYDEVKNSAELIVEKATASYQLSGSQSSVYGEPVAIDLAKGTYTISLTTNNGQALTYQLQAGDLAFENGTTPTKRGRYNVVLSAAGLQHLQALNANYTWDAEKSTSTAYYQINPAEMYVGLGGATNSVYNNAVQPVPTDKLADLHLVWGGSDTIPSDTNAIDLQADDFDYYQKQEDGSFKKVEPKDAGKYYLVLNETGLNRLNAANPNGNYTFTLNDKPSQINYGTYTIDKYDAKVTLTGSQSAEYGYAQQLAVKNFHLVVLDKDNNQIIQVPDDMIAAGDLIIKGQPTTTAHPNDVGTYDVEITDALLQKLEKEYPNINFEEENVSSSTDSTGNKQPINSKNNDGKYIITTIDAYITINGSQSVYYNPEHSYDIDSTNYSVTLRDKNNKEIVIPADIKSKLQFEFVKSPTDAGDYQVKLTQGSINLINGIGANNPNGEDNYAWHDTVQSQKYVVNKVPVTGTLVNAGTDPASSIYGKPINLDNYLDKYKVTLLDQVTNQTVNYTLQKGDLIFVNGDPTTTGTFDVKLSQAGVAHLRAQYPESNYTLGLNQHATFKVTAATPTITITANGESQKTYDANPAEIKPGDFTISITTNNGHTIDYSLNDDDLQFVGQTPTNVGQYDVTIKQSVIDNLKQQFPNYNWDASSITGATGKFTISPAAGSAELSGSVTKPYDGTGISDLSPITVTVNYPGVGENTSYQLTDSDFVIVNDVTGTQYQPSQAPADVGNYHIELTAAGKANIAKLGNSEVKNINWTDASYTGRPTYTISAIAINVTGKGQTQTATYDGSSFGTANQLDLDKFVPTLEAGKVTVPTIPTGTLTNDDYTIKDKDGNVVTDPTKAGDYTVWLNEDGMKKLSDLSSNFTWPTDPVQMGTLTINQAEITGTLSGSNSKTYDGDDVSTTDINQQGGTITVQVTVNGVTYNYSLQDGDYTWNTKDGQAPTAAGSYTDKIVLDTTGELPKHLTDFLVGKDSELAGNFKIDTNKLTGSASFTINKKDATVSLGGSDHKDYDGSAGSVTLDQLLNNLSSKDLVNSQTLDTTGLTLADFTWSNPDHTPAGEYTISLTPTGLEKLQANNPNYNISVEGSFAYTINKSAASAVLAGSGQKTYNGERVSSADLQNGNITVKVTLPGQTDPQTVTLGVSDFAWNTSDGKAPTNAGAYTITINDQGKQAIEDQFADNQNIDWTKSTFTGSATYKINKAAGTINFTGSDGKDFDNKEMTSLDKDKFYVTVNGNKVALPDDGFEIVDKDGKQVTPKDAGTYYIVLTDKGLQELQKDSNYSWTPNWNGNTVPNEIGTYVINQAKATPSLSGQTAKTYNGDATTLAEVTKDGKITVSVDLGNTEFTIPNYALTVNDYEWLGTDGQKLSAPTDAGKYIIKLNDTGLQNIQAYLDKTYGQGNVLVDSTKDSGQANFEITPFEVTVTINGKATVGAGTTTIPDGKYSFNFDPTKKGDKLPNGWQAPTLSASELEFTGDAPTAETKNGTFTVNYKGGQAALQTLLGENYQVTYTTASNNYIVAASTHVIDYQDKDGNPVGNQTVSGDPDEIVPFTPEYPAGWKPVDPASVPTTVPVDGGTTTIIVEHKVITVTPDDPKTSEDNLPDTPGKDYPDGNKYPAGVSESDLNKTITRTIIEKLPSGDKTTEQKVTFTRTATVDLVTGEVKYGDWTKSGAWSKFTPGVVSGYTANPTVVKAEDVAVDTKDQTVTINYTANVADEQTVTIKFVDDDKGGSQVGDSITKNGKTGESVQLGLSVPENYKLAEGQTLPTDYTFTSAKDQTITIHLVHQTSEVDGNSTDIPEAIKQQLNDEVTRTINYEGLSADQLAQLPAGQKNGTKQTVKFVGSATYDPVDKKLVGDITWKVGTPASYKGFTPKSFPGYTASVSEVPNFAPKQGDKDSTVTISYTANDQTGKISYVDGDGNEISSTPLTGKTGETVTVTPKIPAGWKLVPGQDIPETVTATPDGIPTVTITIQHKKITVTPDDPKTPEDKLPETPGKDYPNGSKYPTGVAKDDLNKDITRTIKVHLPNGSVEQHEQTVHLTRNAVVDLVTGEVTYGAWSTGKWDAFTPQAIDGYTVKPATVSAMTVTAQTTDQTVEINYQKNDTPAPTPVPVQESKEVTETIKYQFADGTEAAPSQVVKIKFTRSGLKDPASGKVTWNEWEPATHAFNAVTSPQIAGYQPDIAIVEKQEVTADSADLSFVVKYVKNDDKPGEPTTPDEPGKPDNPNKPDNPGEPDNPTNPDKPGKPDDPNKPDNPGEPDNPNEPDNPGKPDDPNKPDNPGEPDNPTNPDNPGKPDNPTNPDKPGKPDNPTNPGEPGTPDNPSNPDQPGIPDNPSQPGTGDEDKPGNPTIPDNPSTPNKPDKPSDTDNPGTGEEGKPDTPGKPTPGTPEGPDNGTPLTPDTEKESGSLPVPGDHSPEDSTPSDEKLVSDKQPSNVATDKQNAAKNGVNAKQLPQTGNESGKAAAITGIGLLGVLALCFGFGKKRRDD
ncbi:MBG domain-containing protein [Limosilactobacillus caccae]|uniref:MBG domain-containing protein n=1 Tax=Limosilactobacillus caccae TaxID=1926284 RepID=UPI0009708AA5|nr:MBG domain-containing protein [Limosilactobacillus caccae]